MNPDIRSQAANAWAERFDRFRTADVTVAQFCNAEGVSQAGYYYWRKKLQDNQRVARQKSPDVRRRFVSVALADSLPPRPATVMAVELPGGIRIRFEVTQHNQADS